LTFETSSAALQATCDEATRQRDRSVEELSALSNQSSQLQSEIASLKSDNTAKDQVITQQAAEMAALRQTVADLQATQEKHAEDARVVQAQLQQVMMILALWQVACSFLTRNRLPSLSTSLRKCA
jgi:hypothetical protein